MSLIVFDKAPYIYSSFKYGTVLSRYLLYRKLHDFGINNHSKTEQNMVAVCDLFLINDILL